VDFSQRIKPVTKHGHFFNLFADQDLFFYVLGKFPRKWIRYSELTAWVKVAPILFRSHMRVSNNHTSSGQNKRIPNRRLHHKVSRFLKGRCLLLPIVRQFLFFLNLTFIRWKGWVPQIQRFFEGNRLACGGLIQVNASRFIDGLARTRYCAVDASEASNKSFWYFFLHERRASGGVNSLH